MKYKQPRRFALIGILITLIPLPLIGLIFWLYSLLPRSIAYYIFMPFIMIISIAIYILLLIALSIVVYKTFPPLKEGTFPLNSKETESWMASQLVLKMINIVTLFQIPSNILKGLYKKVFKTKLGDILIINPGIEHSLVDIGNDVIIGQDSKIIGHIIEQDRIYIKKVKIGSNVTIGANSLIFPGVEIGDGTIIGAYSLVPKNKKLEANSLYLGIPARKVKDLKRD